jgi:hypothetical protein
MYSKPTSLNVNAEINNRPKLPNNNYNQTNLKQNPKQQKQPKEQPNQEVVHSNDLQQQPNTK